MCKEKHKISSQSHKKKIHHELEISLYIFPVPKQHYAPVLHLLWKYKQNRLIFYEAWN